MKEIRMAGIIYESLSNGPGIRRVFFLQGCKHNCKGCFNPETHDFNGGILKDMDELIEDTLKNPMITGVTFSGGDPLEQSDKLIYMIKKFKEKNLNIWSYTGYTFEFLLENSNDKNKWKEYLENIDVLVDGKFEIEKSSANLKFRGSSNQRIINVHESLKQNKVILFDL